MLKTQIRYSSLKQATFKLVSYFEQFDKLSFDLTNLQEDRERMVVRRFKFEEPRIEQIQDLEVCIWRYGE